jgi:adenine-specific DNA-methyltransferase
MPNEKDLLEKIESLEAKVNELKDHKKYGLIWENKKEKFEKDSKDALPILREKGGGFPDIITDQKDDYNILIEGDNYHALSVLSYTHRNKIDVIYIDPPYNTGNKDFIYNDHYVDKEDRFRHSKWLSFIEKRLKLAKSLLKNTGIIFISIDDIEVAQLKLLMDRIFGENNKIGIFTVETPNQTSDTNKIKNTDFLLVYGKTSNANFRLSSKEQIGRCTTGKENQTQPIIEFPSGLKVVGVKDGIYKDTRKIGGNEDISIIKGPIIIKNGKLVKPIKLKARWANPNDIKRFIKKFISKNTEPIFNKFGKELLDLYFLGDRFQPQMVKNGFETPYSILLGFKQKGGDLLENILHKETFKYPKHPAYIKYLLSMSTDKNSTILDFMAGSGTTGHASLELNDDDDGHRKFILCTNNENKICEDITYERIKKVILGYKDKSNNKVISLGGNLKYLKTDFVKLEKSIDTLKHKMVEGSTEILCLKENSFDLVHDNYKKNRIKIFQNKDKYTAILFDLFYFDNFVEELKKLKDKFVSVYVFSYAKDFSKEEFGDLDIKFTIEPIPEKILETYKKIFNF